MIPNIILWDGLVWDDLLPFTFTRPAGLLRCGILTIAEKYMHYSGQEVSHLTRDYLRKKYPVKVEDLNLLINAAVLPDPDFLACCAALKPGESLVKDGSFLAGVLTRDEVMNLGWHENIFKTESTLFNAPIHLLDKVWKIFSLNDFELRKDFYLLTKGRKSEPIHHSNTVFCEDDIFLEEGATVLNSSLNASTGPIYIAKDAEIMEGSLVRGPFALGEHSSLKLGTKIYGATTIGPHCKVGGEVNNSVFYGYSNKAHDGFLGNAAIGEWCNIGADSNNSNLKNNYEEVKLWNYAKGGFVKTGLTFCGLFMGDHSKCGINTMFNTGTVVGVSANIFGAGFPRNFIPSFSWGGAGGFTTYQLNKAYETAERVYERRKMTLTAEDREILQNIFDNSASLRTEVAS